MSSGNISDFQPKSKSVRYEHQSANGYVRRMVFTNPLALAAASLISAHAIDGSLLTTFVAQPDYPRPFTIVANNTATGNVVITGTDVRGDTISDTIALNGNTPVAGVKAFKTVTSVQLPTVSNRTINIGIDTRVGLDRKMAADEVLYLTCDGVYEATRPTVTADSSVISKNLFAPNTAFDGAKDYVIAFVTTELY